MHLLSSRGHWSFKIFLDADEDGCIWKSTTAFQENTGGNQSNAKEKAQIPLSFALPRKIIDEMHALQDFRDVLLFK